jgi:hypothetical protein
MKKKTPAMTAAAHSAIITPIVFLPFFLGFSSRDTFSGVTFGTPACGCGAPQNPQNFAPSGNSLPQLAQKAIFSPPKINQLLRSVPYFIQGLLSRFSSIRGKWLSAWQMTFYIAMSGSVPP